jgi:hypothetical protein
MLSGKEIRRSTILTWHQAPVVVNWGDLTVWPEREHRTGQHSNAPHEQASIGAEK